jgi:hypothetical protein
MRRLLHLSVLAGLAITCLVGWLAGWLAWRYGAVTSPFGAVTSQMSNPNDGKVANGTYTNRYFGLSFPLPQGWTEGEAGPDPSHSGYYVLGSFIPKGELTATILVAAQDMFFAAKPQGDATSAANDFRRAMSEIEGMTIDREPIEVKIADRVVQRVDFSGVGLYRAMLVAEMRCHLVSFNLTTRDPAQLASLTQALDRLSFAAGNDGASSVPVCVKDYAVADNLLSKVEPAIGGPVHTPIPVRIIIGTDGSIRHVHVIRAAAEQRRAIEDALRQWKFRPYEREGRAVAVETDLIFKSKQRDM